MGDELKEDISLKARKKLPKEIKEKRNKAIIKNLIIGIAILLYFIVLNLGYINIVKDVFSIDLKVFSVILLSISIVLFEKGYKNDNEEIFFNGAEILVLAFITLIMPYIMYEAPRNTSILVKLSFLYFVIYYIIKALFNARKVEKEYLASDAKEIVKK